jgi:transposase
VLHIDPYRFRRSRDAGCFLGLRPGGRNSGMSEPQMHISKEGHPYLRTLMVQGAHYILGPFGQDSDLRLSYLHEILSRFAAYRSLYKNHAFYVLRG